VLVLFSGMTMGWIIAAMVIMNLIAMSIAAYVILKRK
jgi:hypothetical protein